MKKLKNDKGASIIFALVAFMVASIISVVIISASLSALTRIRDNKKKMQESLALESAAELLKNDMSGTVYKEVHTQDKNDTTIPETVDYTYPSCMLKDKLVAALGTKIQQTYEIATTTSFTITTSGGELSQVNGSFILRDTFAEESSALVKHYEIYITLENANSKDRIYITIPVEQVTETSGGMGHEEGSQQNIVTVITCTLKEAKISNGLEK